MNKTDDWRGDPCICGDVDGWHVECYAKATLEMPDIKRFGLPKLRPKPDAEAELRIENYRLHRAMAELQDRSVANELRVHSFETVVLRMMAAENTKDHKEWLALHHDLYALMTANG